MIPGGFKVESIIEIRDLRKYFGKGPNIVKAVDGISLKIRSGEVFGFLGPNGAGKTTSLRMILGLLEPDSGEILINGKKIGKNSLELKKRVGIIPQDLVFYRDLTVEENLWFLANAYKVPKLLAKTRIDSLINQLGLHEKRKTLARKLSGGQKKRLNLLLGLVHDPEIIFCDEPTPGLDPQSRAVVWEYILQLAKEGKTIVLTTHLMEEAERLSDRVAIMDYGKILVLDTPEVLKASIGQGDLLEVELNDQSVIDDVKNAFNTFEGIEEVLISGTSLIIRCRALISKLNLILGKIESFSEILNVNMRRTTLEDVFLHLTGRKLRN